MHRTEWKKQIKTCKENSINNGWQHLADARRQRMPTVKSILHRNRLFIYLWFTPFFSCFCFSTSFFLAFCFSLFADTSPDAKPNSRVFTIYYSLLCVDFVYSWLNAWLVVAVPMPQTSVLCFSYYSNACTSFVRSFVVEGDGNVSWHLFDCIECVCSACTRFRSSFSNLFYYFYIIVMDTSRAQSQ